MARERARGRPAARRAAGTALASGRRRSKRQGMGQVGRRRRAHLACVHVKLLVPRLAGPAQLVVFHGAAHHHLAPARIHKHAAGRRRGGGRSRRRMLHMHHAHLPAAPVGRAGGKLRTRKPGLERPHAPAQAPRPLHRLAQVLQRAGEIVLGAPAQHTTAWDSVAERDGHAPWRATRAWPGRWGRALPTRRPVCIKSCGSSAQAMLAHIVTTSDGAGTYQLRLMRAQVTPARSSCSRVSTLWQAGPAGGGGPGKTQRPVCMSRRPYPAIPAQAPTAHNLRQHTSPSTALQQACNAQSGLRSASLQRAHRW